MKVLIVDDSLLANHALKSYFTKLGHEIVGLARSGEDGKIMYDEKQPDLVTVDSVMPGMSGTELVQFINERDRENGTWTRILMISSADINRTERDGILVDSYIVKPVTLEKIKTAIENF